ncbi:hypothetical protein N7481_013388 [Penicillium waksmanii]|uniref:uncharacterized protein n=1 Tax=Penicillium waksmanii TaxID=69791 RepID=UPI0025491559|nr:uncharacterized protein N7481_013388 [Penicillium waksmanii]KAJ5963083.1 hypothetical protein N7481_013388 [Penicillium waksmanii]
MSLLFGYPVFLENLHGKTKPAPKKNIAEQTWSDDRVDSLRARQQKRKIVDTLNKEPKLVPIQDAATRWKPTFFMLVRAKKPQQAFRAFCSYYDQKHFALSQEQWRQVDYLIYTLQSFHRFTTILSKSKDVTIHRVFKVYNKLFDQMAK